MIKYYKQEMPDIQKKGETKCYFRSNIYTNIHGDRLFRRMGMPGNGLNEEQMYAAVKIIRKTLIHYLSTGHNVTIDGLGTFRLSLGMREGKEMEDLNDESDQTKRNAQSVCVKSILFKPLKDFVDELDKETQLERGDTKMIKRSSYSLEERKQLALDYLNENTWIRPADYAKLTGLSLSSARVELRELSEQEGSGVTHQGRGSHKLYVKG